jgi:uncharacterized protein (TIGR02246 family)
MKKLVLIMGIAIAAMAISCSDDNTSTFDLQKESNAIVALINVDYRDALASSDAEAVTSVFTSDGVVMGVGSPTATGTGQLKSAYEGIFSAVQLNLSFKIDEIITGRNLGFVRSTSSGTATVNASGASAPEENRELFVVQKVEEQWKIARYIYNKMGVLSQATTANFTENETLSYSQEDKTAISTLVAQTYAGAIASSNADKVTDLFTSDGVLMAPDAPTVVGSTAIKSAYQGVFSAVGLDLSFSIDDVAIDGEYGYVRSHSGGNVTVQATGDTALAGYREIFVVKKVDGQWKIAWYHYNQAS